MNRSYTKLLKFGICYIVQKVVVNKEQIRFHQKGRIRRRVSELSVYPYMTGEALSECYFESDSSNFEIGARVTLLLDSKGN